MKITTRAFHFSAFGLPSAPACADATGMIHFRVGFVGLPNWTEAESWIASSGDSSGARLAKGCRS